MVVEFILMEKIRGRTNTNQHFCIGLVNYEMPSRNSSADVKYAVGHKIFES